MSEARLSTLTTRLLAGASVLSLVGVGLVMRFAWDSAAVVYGPQGETSTGSPALEQRLQMVLQDLSYRQVGIPLVVSSALAAAAVATLHRHPSPAQVRRLRWEVLGAGLLTLVVVVLFALANLYVLAGPAPMSDQPFGPPSPFELTAGNLTALAASLLILTAATLWWLRLEPAADGTDDAANDATNDEPGDDVRDDREVSVEQEAVSVPAPVQASPGSSDSTGHEGAKDYSRDWSPEDFRRPS
ncbi:hypothetical protein JNB_15763 [Janibacter sp. HTCC2649]|uniref:hypothetical protein n=1 Tax=Janibacter sp. HTCC2649 TaxID=313589 RepID=UPI00006718D9|nr:hypothetical protein [Janibacter sp. HTCC2649]EAP98435.1 hypothetical protein JNB_15763 [Janibacter sp. HTCC2649]